MTENENLLKQTAVTFASEAVASDMKQLLLEKAKYNVDIFRELNRMIKYVSQSGDRKIRELLIQDSPLMCAIQRATDDFKVICGAYDILLQKLFKDQGYMDPNGSNYQEDVPEPQK